MVLECAKNVQPLAATSRTKTYFPGYVLKLAESVTA